MEGIYKQNEICSQEPRSTNNNQEQIKETKKIENLKKKNISLKKRKPKSYKEKPRRRKKYEKKKCRFHSSLQKLKQNQDNNMENQ